MYPGVHVHSLCSPQKSASFIGLASFVNTCHRTIQLTPLVLVALVGVCPQFVPFFNFSASVVHFVFVETTKEIVQEQTPDVSLRHVVQWVPVQILVLGALGAAS